MRQVTRLALPESVETHNVSSTVCHALLALVWEYPVPFGLFFYVSRSAVLGTLFLGVSGELFTTGTPETIMCQCVGIGVWECIDLQNWPLVTPSSFGLDHDHQINVCTSSHPPTVDIRSKIQPLNPFNRTCALLFLLYRGPTQNFSRNCWSEQLKVDASQTGIIGLR